MKHVAKPFEHLAGGLEGFSARQISAHLKLYFHYVDKLNEVERLLGSADRATADYSFGAYSELKRREAVPFNGAYLHDLYFSNLRPMPVAPPASFVAAAASAFGSFDGYLRDLSAAAKSTAGWVVTTVSEIDGGLHNYVLSEHHVGYPVGQRAVLALDCWEHAYMMDYGTDKVGYLEAFLKQVDWQEAGRRFDAGKAVRSD